LKLSKRHKAFIHDHMKTLSAREIAGELDLGQQQVQRYIKLQKRDKKK